MIQYMKFKGEVGSLEISECYSNGLVEIVVRTRNESNQFMADERYLREMRKWITVQIRKIKVINPKTNTTAK